MSPDQVQALVVQLTISAQFAVTALLAGLVALLGRRAAPRAYVRAWAVAWGAQSVALGALWARYMLASDLHPDVGADAPWVRGFHFVYLWGKLAYAMLLVLGARRLVGRSAPARAGGAAVAAAGLWSLAAIATGHGLGWLVLWQIPVVVPALVLAAATVLRARGRPRTLGLRLTGAALGAAAALWTAYAFAFGQSYLAPLLWGHVDALDTVQRFNPLLDVLVAVALGFGTASLLAEDARRETEAALRALDRSHAELRRVTLHDPLTGVLNRRAFAESDELETGTGAVAVVDLDNLKSINDAYGHVVGDAAIRHLAVALGRALGAAEQLYRWGGDEFVAVLPGADPAAARERLERAVGELSPLDVGIDYAPVRLTVSLGTAPYAAADAADAIARADEAMYVQKARRKLRGPA